GSAPLSVPGGTGRPSAPHFARPLQLRFPARRAPRGLRLRESGVHYAGAAEDDVNEVDPGRLPELTPLGQFDETLILAQSPTHHPSRVAQHRAPERILYRELLKQRELFARAEEMAARAHEPEVPGPPGQLLLEPLLVELTPLQAE